MYGYGWMDGWVDEIKMNNRQKNRQVDAHIDNVNEITINKILTNFSFEVISLIYQVLSIYFFFVFMFSAYVSSPGTPGYRALNALKYLAHPTSGCN